MILRKRGRRKCEEAVDEDKEKEKELEKSIEENEKRIRIKI